MGDRGRWPLVARKLLPGHQHSLLKPRIHEFEGSVMRTCLENASAVS